MNDAPTASSIEEIVSEDESMEIELLGYDVEGDSLIYEVVVDVRVGELSQTSSGTSSVTHSPIENYNGVVTFSYQVRMGN